MFPSRAYADTFQISDASPQFLTDSDGDWTSGVTVGRTLSEMNMMIYQESASGSGTGSESGTYQTPNISGTITVPTASGGGANGGTWYWYTNDYQNQNYSKNISLTERVSFTSATNGLGSGYDSVLVWPTSNLSGDTCYVGLRYYQSNEGNYLVRQNQRVRLVHPSRTIGKMDDEIGTNFSVSNRALNNWKLYAVTSSNPTLCTVDDSGCYVIPKNSTALWLVCEFAYNGGNYYVVDAPVIWLVDDSTTNAINQQTQQLMSTEGSDSIASGAVEDAQEGLENVSIKNFAEEFESGLSQGVTTQEVDGTFVFPGLQLSGFSIPTVSVRPMALLPTNLQSLVRMFVTFVVCAACVRTCIETIENILGIDHSRTQVSIQSLSSDEDEEIFTYWA